MNKTFVGLYGGGQPEIKVRGKLAEGEKALFTFDGRRSGVSAGARMGGAFMTDEAIQAEDIRSLVKDLSDFMDQQAKHQPSKQPFHALHAADRFLLAVVS